MANSPTARADFEPDWATHPGEHLDEYLEVNNWSQAEFARRSGLTPKLVSEIINRKNPVTPETALVLERVFGLKAEIWLGYQTRWDLLKIRAHQRTKPAPATGNAQPRTGARPRSANVLKAG